MSDETAPLPPPAPGEPETIQQRARMDGIAAIRERLTTHQMDLLAQEAATLYDLGLRYIAPLPAGPAPGGEVLPHEVTVAVMRRIDSIVMEYKDRGGPYPDNLRAVASAIVADVHAASLASRPAPGAADEDAEDFRASMEISGRTTKRFIEGLPSREPPAPNGEPPVTAWQCQGCGALTYGVLCGRCGSPPMTVIDPPAPGADLAGMLDGRITAYLSGGGLWNPELADHDAVRDLLIDARAAFAQAAREREEAQREWAAVLNAAREDAEQAESALATAEKERGQEEAAGDLHRNLNGATYLALHGERHGDWSKMPAEVAALKESLATAQAETAALREALTDASPYREAQWSIIDPDRDPVEAYREMLSHGSGNIHCVWLRDHPLSVGEFPRPEHAVLLCITGNGPKSEANAKAIIALWTAARALLSRPATEETP